MKAVITLHRYDGGIYASLVALDGRATCIAESNLHTNRMHALTEMRRYARENNIEVMWTETHITQRANF